VFKNGSNYAKPLALVRRLAVASAMAYCSSGAAAQGPMEPVPRAEMHKRMCSNVDAVFAARMAFLQTRIAPTSEQAAEWDVFVSSSRVMLGHIKTNCNSPDAGPPNSKDAVAILTFRERAAKQRVDLYRAERAAVERLMKVLSPEQQQNLADALLAPPPPPFLGPMAGPVPGLPL
jgi:hypothetical protein